MWRQTIGMTLLLAAYAPQAARAAAPDGELADLSLEQLSNVVVTSVSRQQERLSNVPAAIYLISAADIRRSGARSIPEALRLAPNLQVAKVDARNYAITARGFNSPFENKLLVMIDGRSIYSPLFSGVFWDAQDVVMEDIERIEVISGPGATIWGANAVNGVINVITKAAADTQGGLMSAAVGEHDADGLLRVGGAAPGGGHYRLYAKYAGADDSLTEQGVNTVTGWHRQQAGFRADWALDSGGMATFSGDGYDGYLGQFGTAPIRIAGANLQGRLTRKLTNGDDLRLQVILDHTERNQPLHYVEKLDTVDLELQHGFRLGQIQNVIWGAGYRHAKDQVVNGPSFGFLPGDLGLNWSNVFAQDEISLRPQLKLTAGLKAERNSYTGLEYLPNLRLAWNLDERQLLWTSLSRSVRAPSRIDRDLYAPTVPIIIAGKPFFALGGGPDFQSEVAKVLELGYRAQPLPSLSYSVTAYYNDYERLRTLEPHPTGAVFSNLGEGSGRGLELWGMWQPADIWRLDGGLVLQRVQTDLMPGSHDASDSSGLATNDPARHWLLRSALDLSDRLQLDATWRHTSSLPSPAVPAYSELDVQLLWKPRPDIDVALMGQNLLHARHVEFGGAGRSEFQRNAVLKLSKRF